MNTKLLAYKHRFQKIFSTVIQNSWREMLFASQNKFPYVDAQMQEAYLGVQTASSRTIFF